MTSHRDRGWNGERKTHHSRNTKAVTKAGTPSGTNLHKCAHGLEREDALL